MLLSNFDVEAEIAAQGTDGDISQHKGKDIQCHPDSTDRVVDRALHQKYSAAEPTTTPECITVIIGNDHRISRSPFTTGRLANVSSSR